MRQVLAFLVVGFLAVGVMTGCDEIELTPELLSAAKALNLDKDEISALLSDQHAYWSFMAKLANAQKTKVEVPYGVIAAVESYRAQGLTPPIELAKAATIRVTTGATMPAPPRPPKTSEIVVGGVTQLVPLGFGYFLNDLGKAGINAAGDTIITQANRDISQSSMFSGGDMAKTTTTTTITESSEMMHEGP